MSITKHEENVLKVIRVAKDMISDERHWTKFTTARNSSGKPVDGYSKDACQWCASAAIRRAAQIHFLEDDGDIDLSIANSAILLVRNTSSSSRVRLHDFNDDHQTRHEDIIEAFTRAIDTLAAMEAGSPPPLWYLGYYE